MRERVHSLFVDVRLLHRLLPSLHRDSWLFVLHGGGGVGVPVVWCRLSHSSS